MHGIELREAPVHCDQWKQRSLEMLKKTGVLRYKTAILLLHHKHKYLKVFEIYVYDDDNKNISIK